MSNGMRTENQGKQFQSLEGFIVSLMRNFFLDLSVDQIEVLCTNFARKFIDANMESNQPKLSEIGNVAIEES